VKVQEQAAEFLVYIKQECVTTQVTIDNIIEGVDHLFQLYNQFLKVYGLLICVFFCLCHMLSCH